MSNTMAQDADPSPVTPSSATQGASIEQSVRLFKVFEALRNGDTAAISRAAKGDDNMRLEGTSILHLAIQCAELAVTRKATHLYTSQPSLAARPL
jgi:hypothetical protein